MFGLTTAFFLATAVGWIVVGALAVFVFGGVDAKFRHAPVAAFQIELMVGAVFTVLSTVVVGIATAVFGKQLSINRKAVLVAIAWGLAYPLLWRFAVLHVLGKFDPESLVASAAGWTYLVAFPILMFFALTRIGGRNERARGQGAL